MTELLKIEKLCVSFGGIRALHEVSFGITTGSVTALIGPNGAGKTTVFNCVTGFYRAQAGKLVFKGKFGNIEISKLLGQTFAWYSLFSLSGISNWLRYNVLGGSHLVALHGIGRTFQNIRLFKDLTVKENLLVALHKEVSKNILASFFRTKNFLRLEQQAEQKAMDWLKIFELDAYQNHLAGELSYGLQRRLEIARALCTQPKLICLDEPAAGLNPNETADLSALIKRIRDEFKVTVFVIEHDMSMVMNISDHIIVLDHGQVIAQGKPMEIKANHAVIAAYLGVEE
jgi:branched-chain amino acid transport system ATP-binding protein